MWFENEEERRCTYFGELSLPVPFSILAAVLSLGVGISAFLKGADKDGREKEGTAFFTTMLALVDILLRVNWGVLAWLVLQKQYFTAFYCLLGLIGFSLLINFFLWRRYFYSRYKYEDTDPLFSAYATKFSRTASVVTFLSYLVTFQAIRLAYSRFLGKKQFSAGFTRRRRYYRLIGRLTVFEAIFVYGPAIALNIYNLTYMTDRKEMQFWMNIDSLALQAYALLLIIVVLTQRESLMNYKSYFSFGELFKFGPSNEEEEVPLEYRAGVAAALRMGAIDDKTFNQFMASAGNPADA